MSEQVGIITESERQLILRKAIDTYGINPQVDQCIEECSELIKALLKKRRADHGTANLDHETAVSAIVEEIADVKIMLEQMELLYGPSSEIEQQKLARMKQRIEEYGMGVRP